jgi:hypothetical protein
LYRKIAWSRSPQNLIDIEGRLAPNSGAKAGIPGPPLGAMSGLSASVLLQEFQKRIVYVFGALLLSPMTATFQDYCLAKQGHELFQARDEMATKLTLSTTRPLLS